MLEYTWEIESVDEATATMVVSYLHGSNEARFNIPIPTSDIDLGTWVDSYAPKAEWQRASSGTLAKIEPGMTGTGAFEPGSDTGFTETPNVVGSWNEEYLRAIIYSVMEEMRESTL